MKQTLIVLGVACLTLCLEGCGYKTAIVQKDSLSYIRLVGDLEDCTIYVDNTLPMILHQVSEATGKSHSRHFSLQPGTHHILIKKDEHVIVDKDLLIGTGMTQEIQVP